MADAEQQVEAGETDDAKKPRAWGFRRELRNLGAGIAAAIWLTMLVAGGDGFALDLQLYGELYAGEHPDVARRALLLTRLGDGVVLSIAAVVMAIGLAFVRRMRAALLLITVFTGRLLIEFQKIIVDRDRPGVEEHLEAVHSMSFPSGHSGNAMITYLMIALLLPVAHRWRAIPILLALGLALAAGWSRVALGIHWPSECDWRATASGAERNGTPRFFIVRR
jgi:undecaprenyl-diphosphatase